MTAKKRFFRIFIPVLVLCCIAFLIFAFWPRTYRFESVLTDGRTETPVEAVCRFRNIDTILQNDLHGTVTLTPEGGEARRIELLGSLFTEMTGLIWAPTNFYRADINRYDACTVIMDPAMENLVILFDDHTLYAAEDSFIPLVREYFSSDLIY